MKRLNLMLLAIGVAILFSCSKDNSSLTPDLSQNQATSSLKGEKTLFVGVSNFVSPGEDGTQTILPNGNILIQGQTVVWYDEAPPCWEVTGISNWTANWLITGENTAKLWGKCEIFVGSDPANPDVYIGKWMLSWHGWQTPTLDVNGEPDGGFIIVCDANGIGKEGVVKGMVGKWTYSMNIANGFFYATEGYIK